MRLHALDILDAFAAWYASHEDEYFCGLEHMPPRRAVAAWTSWLCAYAPLRGLEAQTERFPEPLKAPAQHYVAWLRAAPPAGTAEQRRAAVDARKTEMADEFSAAPRSP